jgi:DNA-binding PadR family transcriptional regulator
MTPRADPPTVDDFLPLRPVEALVLTMLSSGERHGYGVRQDILEHSGGRIELEAGSLYRYIRRLEADGLIEAAAARRAARDDDPRRIYYRLTPLGRRVLAAEMTRLRELVRLAEARRIIGSAPA